MKTNSNTYRTSRTLAQTLLALADPIRLRMLNLMMDWEVSVPCLTVVLKVESHVLSKHLICLRNGGLIAGRRTGKTWHYFVRDAPDSVESQLLELALRWLRNTPEMKGDLALVKAIWKVDRRARILRGGHVPSWSGTDCQANAAVQNQPLVNGHAEKSQRSRESLAGHAMHAL